MKRYGFLLVLGALSLSACAADATGSAAPESNASASDQGTLLTRVTGADGRAVSFFEMAPGTLRVEESGTLATRPNPLVASASSAADAYRLVAGDEALPASLSSAIARFDAAAAAKVAPLAAPPAEISSKPRPMNTGTENWFQSQFCGKSWTQYCAFSNTGSVGVPWTQVNAYTEVFMDDPSDETDAVLTDYLWNGSSFVADFHVATAPGTWMSERWFNASMVYREASVGGGSGPGGVAPVGLETEARNASAVVSYAGQWVFDGKWFINDKTVTITALNPPVGGSWITGGTVSTDGMGTFHAVMPVTCAPHSTVPTFNFQIKGDQTGETYIATGSFNVCWG